MPKFRLMNREKTRRFDGKKEVLNFRYLDFSITGNGNTSIFFGAARIIHINVSVNSHKITHLKGVS